MNRILLFIITLFTCAGINAQSFWEDNFDDGDISDWTLNDVDGDGRNWTLAGLGVDGSPCIISESWFNNNGVGVILNPNNYITTPAIDLSGATGEVGLSYSVFPQDPTYAAEKYKIVVSNSNELADIDAATVVFEETLATQDAFEGRYIDLTSYAGQTIYITFIHYDVSDQFIMNIDDLSVFTPSKVDLGLEDFSFDNYYNAGQLTLVSGTLKSWGLDEVSSMELSLTINDEDPIIQEFTGLSLNRGDDFFYTFNTPLTVAAESDYDIKVDVVSVNALTDDVVENNTNNTSVHALSFIPAKKVVGEEATGTWCPWCPRGEVIMDRLTADYEDFIGIAVHNRDPMTVAEYDTGFNSLIGGYPSLAFDRADIDIMPNDLAGYGDLTNLFNQRLNRLTPVSVGVSASYKGSGEITIDVSSEFAAPLSGDYRFNVIITEDGVSGTTTDWDQFNNYAGGQNGAMEGYENLPNPVPASQMIYDHVGIATLGGFEGTEGSLPVDISRSATHEYTYSYIVTDLSRLANMHVVAMVIDNETGIIMNAEQTSLFTTDVADINVLENDIRVFPNPASDFANVQVNLSEAANVKMTVSNMMGQVVEQRNYGSLNGKMILPIVTSNFENGVYIINLDIDGQFVSKKLSVNR